MFEDMKSAIEWAKKNYPNCSFSVREQADGPTIVSVKGKNQSVSTVVYVKKGGQTDGGKQAL